MKVSFNYKWECFSECHGRLLDGQQVEALFALHALLLVGIVGGEAGGVSTHSGVLIFVMELMIEKQC